VASRCGRKLAGCCARAPCENLHEEILSKTWTIIYQKPTKARKSSVETRGVDDTLGEIACILHDETVRIKQGNGL
jgi:hypothetical protein